jgi:hypothetical protein
MRTLLAAFVAVVAGFGCLSVDHEGAARLYESCPVMEDTCTAAADGCYLIHNGQVSRAMCSSECTDDRDCGTDGECGPLPGDVSSTNICYRTCWTDDDCFAGFTCQDTDFARACMP